MVTKTGFLPEIAHIYPFSLGAREGEKDFRDFNLTLRMFWTEEHIHSWHKSITGDKVTTEVCQNMITLCTHVHGAWEKAAWALKPLRVSDDHKKLEAQFFWLQIGTYAKGVSVMTRPSLPDRLPSGPKDFFLHDCKTLRQITSGNVIVIETDDPINHPLPSFELLQMQWVLHRVLALSGAGEADDKDFDPDDDVAAGDMSEAEEIEVDSEEEEEAASRPTVDPYRQSPVRRAGENQPPSPAKGKGRDQNQIEDTLVLRPRVN